MLPVVTRPLRHDIKFLIQGLEGARMGTSNESEKLKAVDKRIARLMHGVHNQAVINVPTAVLFGCWPFLQSCSAYFLPIPWFSAGIVTGFLLLMGAPSKHMWCFKSWSTEPSSGMDSNEKSMLSMNNNKLEKQDSALSCTDPPRQPNL